MQYKILNEQPWQILSNAMTISPSSTGYDLQVSANGKDYTTMFHVNEGVTRQVTNLSSGSYFRMSGNVGEVVVNWVRDCSGGDSGGGSGSGTTYTAGEFISIEQDVISVTGITPSSYATHAEVTAATENLASENYVDAAITAATQGMATQQDIQTAIASETARTENTYAKESELGNYYTTAQTYNRTEIDEKVASGGTFDPTNYYTKAQVDEEIDDALTGYTSQSDFEDFQTEMMNKEEVVASALTELQSSIPDMSDYYTKDEVDAEITGATQGLATQAYVTAATQNLASQAYVTSAVTAATQNMATQAYVTGITSPMQTAINNKVTNGGGISTMRKISQADYDDLVSGGTVDSATFYVITGTTS